MHRSSFKFQLPFRLASVLILCSFAFSFLPPPVKAQTAPEKTRQLTSEDAPVKEHKRIALVIGNGAYQHTSTLANPVNDATDMRKTLEDLGFDVLAGTDQTKAQMVRLIREFGEKLNKQDDPVGLFFYAGHGVQSQGDNYLIPVDAEIPIEDEIDNASVNVDLVFKKIETAKNSFNIVMLDACRNNPFAKSWSKSRGGDSDGLTKIGAPRGTVMFYASEPGKVALDGKSRNGTFTAALLEQIKKPDLEFSNVVKAVTRSVQEKSQNKQNPFIEGSSTGDFYFARTTDKVVSPSAASAVKADVKQSNVVEKDAAAREQETWDSVADSSDEKDFRVFLDGFPDGANAAKARIRLEQIVWDSIKTSNDKAALIDFLNEFPNGANKVAARIKLQRLKTREATQAVNEAAPKTAAQETSKVTPKETPAEEITAKTGAKEAAPKTIVPGKIKSARVGGTRRLTAAEKKLVKRENAVGIEFASIPAGSFSMGLTPANLGESLRVARKDYADFTPDQLDNEKPARRVTIGSGFWMGRFEITQAQWSAVMGENPSYFKNCDDCPIENVSWKTIQIFLRKLNEQNDGFEYRLPTEAEWEYAARAGTGGIFSGPIEEMSWHSGNSEGKTHPVGMQLPNPFGLYDMNGNVSEWCEDVYSPTYEGLTSDGSANTEIGDKKSRVIRGGSWNNYPTLSRATWRGNFYAGGISMIIGFRIVAVQKK